MNRKEKVLRFMQEKEYVPLLFEELVMVLDVKKEARSELSSILDELMAEGEIIQTKKKRFAATSRMGLVCGRVQGNRRGFGFVCPDEGEDVFIPQEKMGGAMHGDRVLAQITKKAKGTGRMEGQITEVLSRANKTVVGTYEEGEDCGFVIPDMDKLSSDIFIPSKGKNGAKSGDKVVASITKWGDARRGPKGEITEILGKVGESEAEIMSIIRSYDFPYDFPDEVLDAAEEFAETVSEKEIEGRRDFRDKHVFTIDGADAKDLDDAICIERTDEGYRLYVHIADVSHYVDRGGVIDKEAFRRGTSVYLVDRVIPMLPRALSNGICSLNPKVNRLVLSCIMDIDCAGKVTGYEITKGVICSMERLTYDVVTELLENRPKELLERYKKIVPDLEAARELCEILKAKRRARGSIDFNVPEAKIILDENGKVIDIKKRDVRLADNIIEEFMLVANETVAEHAFWGDLPFVYRSHEAPSEEKIQTLSVFLHNLGYTLKGRGALHTKELQKLIEEIKGKSEERVISSLALRSMMKAKYTPDNLGHYGLAAKYYCHFTSPIRRYADLTIHRILKEQIEGRLSPKRIKGYGAFTPQAAEQASERERAADDAERDTDDLKKAEYMQDKIGEEYEGVISSVTSFGIFVELPNTVEGLVRVEDMADDYYHFDEKNMCLRGERTKKTYALGDCVKVSLKHVDVLSRQIDFLLIESAGKIRPMRVYKEKIRPKNKRRNKHRF